MTRWELGIILAVAMLYVLDALHGRQLKLLRELIVLYGKGKSPAESNQSNNKQGHTHHGR